MRQAEGVGNGVKTGAATLAPVRVTGLNAVRSDAASASAPPTAVGGVLVGGSVQCWGSGSSGDLGNGKLNVDSPVPVVAGGVSGVAAVSIGVAFSCALQTSGTVTCWGSDNFETLGTGAKGKLGGYSLIPVRIKGLP